jgi:anti-anti-sigma factor
MLMNTNHHKTIQRINPAQPQPFNLLMTTSHPNSAGEFAGEVVPVPAEFTERTVLIDLNEVTRIDSWGLALFMEAMQRITAYGGSLVLIRIHEDVRRVLEAAKLDQVFHICANREEALALHCQRHAA